MAREMEGRPFHLILSHCQNQPREAVVSRIRGLGLVEDGANFTVTSFGRHPRIPGSGYIPYYAVFDHEGKLVKAHMGGDYHGGDGLAFMDAVRQAVDRVPALYLGAEPFAELSGLAGRIQARRNLPGSVQELETLLAGDPSPGARAEGERIQSALARYVRNRREAAEKKIVSDPEGVVPDLRALAAEFEGTSLGAPIEERIGILRGDPALRQATSIGRAFHRIRDAVDALPACAACVRQGNRQFRPGCEACRAAHGVRLRDFITQLRRLIRNHAELPISQAVEEYATRLEGR